MGKKSKLDRKTAEIEPEVQEELHTEYDNESDISQDSVHVPLAQLANKHFFLTKVGFAFCIYYLFLLAMCLLIMFDVTHTRILYRAMRLEIVTWVLLAVSIALKILFGFFGGSLRPVIVIGFMLDIVVSCFFIIGLYYYLDDKIANRFTNYAPFVIIYVINLFAGAFVFTILSFYKSRLRYSAFAVTIITMILANVGLIFGIKFMWNTLVTITIQQYVGMMLIFAGINVYFGLNAFLVINRRAEKFMDNDGLYCFFSFWVDWFSFFWIDLFRNNKVLKGLREKMRRIRREKKKKASKKAAKAQNDEELGKTKAKKSQKVREEKEAQEDENQEEDVKSTKKTRPAKPKRNESNNIRDQAAEIA